MAQGGAAHCRKGGKARRARCLGGRARKPAVREEMRARAEECRRPCHRLGEGLCVVPTGELERAVTSDKELLARAVHIHRIRQRARNALIDRHLGRCVRLDVADAGLEESQLMRRAAGRQIRLDGSSFEFDIGRQGREREHRFPCGKICRRVEDESLEEFHRDCRDALRTAYDQRIVL